MDEHIIKIFNCESVGHAWKMTIDLKELAASAGIRKERKGYRQKVISVTLSNAKKLLKLIRQYGSESDLLRCDEYLKPNERLYKYWAQIR